MVISIFPHARRKSNQTKFQVKPDGFTVRSLATSLQETQRRRHRGRRRRGEAETRSPRSRFSRKSRGLRKSSKRAYAAEILPAIFNASSRHKATRQHPSSPRFLFALPARALTSFGRRSCPWSGHRCLRETISSDRVCLCLYSFAFVCAPTTMTTTRRGFEAE